MCALDELAVKNGATFGTREKSSEVRVALLRGELLRVLFLQVSNHLSSMSEILRYLSRRRIGNNQNICPTSQKLQGKPMSVSTTKESQQSIGPRSIILGTLGAGFGLSTTCRGLFGVGLSGVFTNGFALALGVCNLTPKGFIIVLAEERLREDLGCDLNKSPERVR